MALVCTAACGDNLLIHIIMVLILLRSYLFLLSPSLQIWQLELTLGELTTCCTFGDGNLLNLLGGLGLTHNRAGLGGRAVRRLLPANACELWCYGCKLNSYHGKKGLGAVSSSNASSSSFFLLLPSSVFFIIFIFVFFFFFFFF